MGYKYYAVIKKAYKCDREIIFQGSYDACEKKFNEINCSVKDRLLDYYEMHGLYKGPKNSVVRVSLCGYDVEDEDFSDLEYFCYKEKIQNGK